MGEQVRHSPSIGSPTEQGIAERSDAETTTASHELASVEQVEKGVAQLGPVDGKIRDLGWREDVSNLPQPLISDLPNDELCTFIRRFNKQIFHVRSISTRPLADLDLNISEEEEFSAHKLRCHIERLYMTVGIGLFGLWKQVARLRSWSEWRRTSAFFTVYVVAWTFDCLLLLFIGFLALLTVHPLFRAMCFPPAPPALVDGNHGGVKKPMSGVLGSENSMTGAPESHSGEAIEQEAHSFVNSICTLAMSMAAGEEPEDFANAKDKTGGGIRDSTQDRTKQPVADTFLAEVRPVTRSIGSLIDGFERLNNALSPTTPFPKHSSRLRIAAWLLLLLGGSWAATSYLIVKGIGFVVGFAIFGRPITNKAMKLMDRIQPEWIAYTELRNTLLRGVPTNAQLTLTLLRIGERNRAPLPPPPTAQATPTMETNPVAIQGVENLNANPDDMKSAIHRDEDDQCESDEEKMKRGSRVVGLLKGTARKGLKLAHGVDRLRAHLGSKHAENRLGSMQPGQTIDAGPICFPARYMGKKGEASIICTGPTPTLSWTTTERGLGAVWNIRIVDIREIQKTGGLGWKSKILVSWATDKEVADGIKITDEQGQEYCFTAIYLRDELFNRLIAVGGQMWELL